MLAYEFENEMYDSVFNPLIRNLNFLFMMERHFERVFAGSTINLKKIMRRREPDKITMAVCGVKKILV